ncbi:MAG: hypothetical protein JWO38_1393 [Gemmataceae bacterium]|nr:hypothetical protein [Gemmataceae bacterium]
MTAHSGGGRYLVESENCGPIAALPFTPFSQFIGPCRAHPSVSRMRQALFY